MEAYLLWKCCSHILIFVAKCDAKSKAWDILLVLTSVAGNLCNKCPSGYLNKTAVKVSLSMWSLVSIEQQSPRRPCDSFCRKWVQISELVWTMCCEINEFEAHSFPIFQRSSGKWQWQRALGRWHGQGRTKGGGEGVGYISVKIILTAFCMHLTLFNQVQVDVHVEFCYLFS